MCLAVPGEVIEISGKEAKVNFGGVQREVRIDTLDNVETGEYVIVHTGFAIEKLDKEEAEKTLEVWKEMEEAKKTKKSDKKQKEDQIENPFE